MRAPSGRARNPIAKTPNAEINDAEGEFDGKKRDAITGAKYP
jgi:hypothetical protein